MSTGTGNLPYPGKSYTPFDILTAEELNEDVANIESLATGTGIGDGSISTAALANASVTAPKIDLATLYAGAARNYVATSQTTAVQTFIDLATAQSITVTVGNSGKLLVGISCSDAQNSTTNAQAWISFALTGSNTVAAGVNTLELKYQAYTNNAAGSIAGTAMLTGLTPGSTTVTMKFRASANTATFAGRLLWVLPL